MANDVAMYELAQELAARTLEKYPSGDPELMGKRINFIFERALGRHPSSSELRFIQSLLAQPASAEASGEREAWITVARAVMNTDEFITRE
jgi:hypothetical protein